jgi:hypothetical protein
MKNDAITNTYIGSLEPENERPKGIMNGLSQPMVDF